jgi:hypothetical protein
VARREAVVGNGVRRLLTGEIDHGGSAECRTAMLGRFLRKRPIGGTLRHKRRSEVPEMLIGPGKFICSECVELCVEALEEQREAD